MDWTRVWDKVGPPVSPDLTTQLFSLWHRERERISHLQRMSRSLQTAITKWFFMNLSGRKCLRKHVHWSNSVLRTKGISRERDFVRTFYGTVSRCTAGVWGRISNDLRSYNTFVVLHSSLLYKPSFLRCKHGFY